MPLQIHPGAPTLFIRRTAYEHARLVRAALDERLGLAYYDDFFELSGNWPEWLSVFAGSVGAPGRRSPSHPHS